MSDFEAVLFDLDGTLVQTERLKAISYARAAVVLSPSALDEEKVIEAFKDVVGRSRYEVAETLLKRFRLTESARSRMEDLGVDTPIDAFIDVRLQFYTQMMDDPLVVQNSRWLHNISQLLWARREGYKTGLATMSHRPQANRILALLELEKHFDFTATRDDVERGKPDPEIYHLVARALDVSEQGCLVFEDSVSGVEAALSAGMHVIAVSTPFTRDSLTHSHLLPQEQLVHDPKALPETVDRLLAKKRSELAA